ncbi:MAG: hypothetical protein IT463_09335 [Planctomycetes bacterium]|nr:hypothetical protein [Planctomycetota bacterium]
MNLRALSRLAGCFLLLLAVSPSAADVDARQAAREMERLFKVDDPAKRLKAAQALTGEALERAAAEAALAKALECQRAAPRKLPTLKAVHEGACEYLYKVTQPGRVGDVIYENFALVDAPPALAADKPVPLVIGLHDALSTAWLELAALRGARSADDHPLRDCLVVCPQALNRGNTVDDPPRQPARQARVLRMGPQVARRGHRTGAAGSPAGRLQH